MAPLLRSAFLVLALVSTACGDDRNQGPGFGGGDDDQACTAMACSDGLDIAFSVKQAGTYSFNLVADGEVTTCGATLPLPPCDQPAGGCSRQNVTLGLSGCALPTAEHSLEGISLTGVHPTSMEVFVSRDGEEIAHDMFSPTYQTLSPNGEECGPICSQATVTLNMPP